MAAMDSEDEFLTDLQKCLDLADQLKEDSSDDPTTQQVVFGELQQLQNFLKQKTEENEEKIKEEIEKEEKEIENLKNRIERATQREENAGDVMYADLDELWHDLKNEYWRTAFTTYQAETKKPEKFILQKLLEILQVTYTHCKIKAKENQNEIELQLLHPGEEIPKKKGSKASKIVDSELQKSIRRCQTRSIPFCLSSVQETLSKELKANKDIVTQFKIQNERLKKDLTHYLEKCVEFCWIASFKEPELRFVTQPMKECKHLKDKFPDLKKTTGKPYKLVEWPALVQGDQVRANWKLFPSDEPEPDGERRVDNGHRNDNRADVQVGEMEQLSGEVDGKKNNPAS